MLKHLVHLHHLKSKENTDYDEKTTLCTATLSDTDGWLGNTTFNILNSNPSATTELEREHDLFEFTFNKTIGDTVFNTTVYLITRVQLDYEKNIFYSFTVQAQDGAGHSTIPNANVTCIVDVGDLNDMPPEWTYFFTTKQIVEKTSYNFNVTAVDGDRGINAPIHYSIISYDEDVCEGCCVTLETVDGKAVLTVNPIDRDAKDLSTYAFRIMAQEEDDPPYNVTLDITFILEDIDDNSPLFKQVYFSDGSSVTLADGVTKIIEFSFLENFAETINGTIWIRDIDTGENAQFSVELVEDEDGEYQNETYTQPFLIVPTAGYKSGNFSIPVKNNTKLDFENETWQNFSFYVHSWDKNETNQDLLLVKIHLIDYNDELPIFGEEYSVDVNETIEKGEKLIQVKATDRDAEDAILEHELVGANAIIKLMEIDHAEGIITVAVDDAFDYDRINPVIFQVQAIDAVRHTTTVSVTVNLLDVNNKAPTYKVSDVIRVDENQKIGDRLNVTITASDVDTTRNLTAEIDWENSFAMKNSQKLTSTAENLKAMRFLDLDYEIDPTANDTIEIYLAINNNNDDQTAPDYETFDTLYLNVTIIDHNTKLPEFADKMSIQALIVVNINDINDNEPIFTDDTIARNRTVYERVKNGTLVGSIEAIDKDIGDIVTYTCISAYESTDWLTCNSQGEITTKTDQIDADTNKVYNITIKCNATDGFFITSQDFNIYVMDTNNQFPQVMVNNTLPSTATVSVLEKSAANTPIVPIGAYDADRDIPFHDVKCTFNQSDLCYESFIIVDSEILVLVGGNDLNRDENLPKYDCMLTCFDNPNREQQFDRNVNSTTAITIKLIDINDHCPAMLPLDLAISENRKKDIDEGANAEIEMHVLTVFKISEDGEEDYTAEELFDTQKGEDSEYRVNDTVKQWNLIAKKDLKDYYGNFVIQMNITDLGDPANGTELPENIALKNQAKIYVTVEKYNYYAPVFLFPNSSKLNFSLQADQEPEKPLSMYRNSETFGNITIRDGAENEGCIDKWIPRFDVSVVNDFGVSTKNFFTIASLGDCTGQLQVTDLYNKEDVVDIVTFQVRITAILADVTSLDENEAPYSQSIDIKLQFVDINDDPIFDPTSWNTTIREGDASLIIPINDHKAFYPNLDDGDDDPPSIYYFLKSDDADILSTFSIELNTGNIKLQTALDYLNSRSYQFKMLCSRNNSAVSSKSASILDVNVEVIEINNHIPQWTQKSFYGAILKSTQKNSIVLTINATDLDTMDQGNLTYSISSDFEAFGSESLVQVIKNNPFQLEATSGRVTLNFAVEANMKGYFLFTVKVEDTQDQFGNGPHENTTTVTIYIVTDDNIITFKFENTLDAVVDTELYILETISKILGWNCQEQNIDKNTVNGIQYDNVTVANIYCMDNSTLLTTDDLKAKLNNINTFQQLKRELLEHGILLQTFDGDSSVVVTLETNLKVALIAVSVILGALCLILAITFFFKTRDRGPWEFLPDVSSTTAVDVIKGDKAVGEVIYHKFYKISYCYEYLNLTSLELSRRITRLTERKFGSDESTINRKGINAPNTNVFAVEGSNPVFKNDFTNDDKIPNDASSIHSGNSDLVGVEDNPDFDEMFGKEKF
ncbi:hypothetical protein HUJ05_001152 [Dendroctonus ponderosae]|nr:hypothetical protein HUJ05_001152 [Dendroctonus ponderosae]